MKVIEISIYRIVFTEGMRASRGGRLRDLIRSVRLIGIKHPISVIKRDDGKYDLVAGRDRFRAAKELGLKTVPVAVFKDARAARHWEISENLHRGNLTALESAEHLAAWYREVYEDQGASCSSKGRPPSGKAQAARAMPGTGSDEAKRKRVEAALLIDAIDPKVKKAIRRAGVDRKRADLVSIAKQKGAAAQMKVLEFVARAKPGSRSRKSLPKEGRNKPRDLAAAWSSAAAFRRAWKSATEKQRHEFARSELGLRVPRIVRDASRDIF